MGQPRVFYPGVFQKILPGRTSSAERVSPIPSAPVETKGKLAVYNDGEGAPEIVDVVAENELEFIELLSRSVVEVISKGRSTLPPEAIHAVVENLVHADFRGVVVSIYDHGRTLRVTDQGPGIAEPHRAFEVGFTTASERHRNVIRGVGSGLSSADRHLATVGGKITVDSNLGHGTVVTIMVPEPPEIPEEPETQATGKPGGVPDFELTTRQKKVLFLVTEIGIVGPSAIAGELGVSLSTAYRDLRFLEECNLIEANEEGKRSLTPEGLNYLEIVLNS